MALRRAISFLEREVHVLADVVVFEDADAKEIP
jgi:hypothetical protein